MTPLTRAHAVGPDHPELSALPVGELLAQAAEQVPDRVALIAGAADPGDRRHWTYRELHAEAVAAAKALMTRFEPGERVAIWAPNIPEWVITQFASAMAGVVLVTVNPAYRSAELAYVLKKSRSAGLLTVRDFRGNPMLATAERVSAECPELREIICFDRWSQFLDSGTGHAAALPPVTANDPVMIQYTSGTTGFPKGALLHHRGLVNNGGHTASHLGVSDGCVWLTTMPLFHVGGCVLCVLGSISKRATQVLVESFDPGLVLELLESCRVNTMLAVPTMLIKMLEHPDFDTRDLSSITSIFAGGSTVPTELVQRFESALDAPFVIVYGQTECSPVATMTRVEDSAQDKGTTIGRAMPHVEVRILDPVTGDVAQPGEIGEICTRGYHVMHGYFEDDDATRDAIDPDGWLHTGDLGAMDERGYCTVEGRLRDMIIRGGENVYPKEIEELLFGHPDVADVAVVGLPDDRWGEVVGAFIRPAAGAAPIAAELTAFCREHLAPFKTPSVWVTVEEFPLTESGKIQKFRLREIWRDQASEAAAGKTVAAAQT